MNEPTQQQKCADLARVMGWDFIPASSEIALPDVGEWYTPLGKIYGDEPPDPFTDHAACHALVAWLATQSAEVWGNFSASVIDSAIPFDQRAYADWEMVTRAVMTAEPAIIAEAAWRAVQGEK